MSKYVGKYIKPKMKRKKKGLIVLAVILILLLALLVGGVIYYNSVLNRINRFDDNIETLSSEELEAVLNDEEAVEHDGDAELETVPGILDVVTDEEDKLDTDIINILLIGQDARSAKEKGRTDSMIMVSINLNTKKLVMTSFMRDLYIDIPTAKGGSYRQRLNTAYTVGGMEKLDETLALNFGVEIDNNIEVDFSGFKTIIDAMGGVDIELTSSEAHHLNTEYDYRKFGWQLVEGVNHLNGEQALAYARIRKIGGDFERTKRQRTVLNELFGKVKNMNLPELLALAQEFIPLITTDMTNSEITNYIMHLAPLLTEVEIVTQRIPADETWYLANAGTKEKPMSVIYCDLSKNREVLRQTIGE